jgi:hypothetical protein
VKPFSAEEQKKLKKAQAIYGTAAILTAMTQLGEVTADEVSALTGRIGEERAFDVLVMGAEETPVGQASAADVGKVALPPTIRRQPSFKAGEASPVDVSDLVKAMAGARGLPVPLLLAMIKQESRFDPSAASEAGAVGLMQLMPDAAKQMGLNTSAESDERLSPLSNLAAGVRYLSWLRDSFDVRTPERLLAAYNAGPGRLKGDAYKKIGETQDYIKSVLGFAKEYEADTSLLESDMAALVNAIKLEGTKGGDEE